MTFSKIYTGRTDIVPITLNMIEFENPNGAAIIDAGIYGTGQPYGLPVESYYRVRDGWVTVQLNFNGGQYLFDAPYGFDEWRLILTGMPVPKDLGTGFRICGTATALAFGNRGSDFMMEWVQSEGKFKFLSAGNGVIRTLSETYKSSLLPLFYGSFPGMSIWLEYEDSTS